MRISDWSSDVCSSDVASGKGALDRGLHLILGNMERTDRVPALRLAGEITLGGGCPVCPHGGEPRGVRHRPGTFGFVRAPQVDRGKRGLHPLFPPQRDNCPCAFLASDRKSTG